jgi:DNA-binding SARP family transcriptional activator
MTVASTPRITLLNGFALHLDDTPSRPLDEELPRSAQRLIAHLCLSGPAPRDVIAGRLWPNLPEERAHGSLRSALWRVHKLAPGLVEASGATLSLTGGVRVDVRELGEWARRVGDPSCGLRDIEVPDAGLRGELLPGWYDDWVLLERERLRQLRLRALELAADRLLAADRYGDALQAAYAAVHAEPLRESAHRAVIRAHLAEGNAVEAVRAYERFREMLADELDCAPSRQISDLLSGVARNGARRARLSDGWQKSVPGPCLDLHELTAVVGHATAPPQTDTDTQAGWC